MSKQKATPTAIAVAAISTLETSVNSFVAELTAAQQTQVRESVKAIVLAQHAMVAARLVVGEHLAKLHNALGNDSFRGFLKVIGPKLGMAKNTAFRYYGAYKMVHGQFGQAAADVLAITDGGDRITTTDQKTGAVVLTREASKVLATMKKDAPLPDSPTTENKEQWARTFVQKLNSENRSISKAKSPVELCEERVTAIWDRFEELIERINKLKGAKERKQALDSLGDTISAMATEHSKLAKTISSIPAEPVKAPKVKAAKLAEPKVA